jgi:formylglycine-generating enzyme required for sulfatase activity
MAPAPHAFLSYTRLDDEAHDGAITALRQRLELRVRAVTGDRGFTIFQDVDAIKFGQHWPSRLDEALAGARFLIPVLSPLFFRSEPCRDELGKFLELERRAGRRDLILPVYLVTAPVLERPALRATDALAQAIHERQWRDWRPYADLPVDHADYRRAISELARAVAAAAEEVELPSPPPPHAPTPAALMAPGTVFRDVEAPWCPELVVVPPGQFLMGSPAGEEGRYDDEGPQHEVRIGYRFALGRYAVTFAEFDAFCEATGRAKPKDQGWGRDRQPVIHVSWEDATAYCAWLMERTGKPYRLPSEAEWEYACRAGTTTPFSFGDTISTAQANYDGNHTYGAGRKGEYRERTLPVDAFQPNGFGHFQMHGNVWEWCEDRWHENYVGAPADGSVWLSKGTESGRVVRGGSWYFGPEDARSAIRYWLVPDDRYADLGFRVSRTLTP